MQCMDDRQLAGGEWSGVNREGDGQGGERGEVSAKLGDCAGLVDPGDEDPITLYFPKYRKFAIAQNQIYFCVILKVVELCNRSYLTFCCCFLLFFSNYVLYCF